jgi:SET domain-containing protein
MYEIKESPIHGNGVFATQDIKAGSKIYDYYGIEMSWSQFTKLYGKYKLNSLNTYPMRRIWHIIVAKEEPYLSQNIINYINEGDSNCILKCRSLYAKREIKKGEELLLQYPKDYNRHWLV